MKLLAKTERGATHADALMASRNVMKQALIEIAWYCEPGEASDKALAALQREHEVYRAGVMRAVD